MKSPFKFLDSYTKDDRDIFFGRDREIEELYQKVFESKILLVYGVSGTGKSSLIHCGLANKFQETDWLPLVVRRGGNIIESMVAAVGSASLTKQQNKFVSPSDFKKGVRSLYLDHYKPVFFIFDQFEELFIFGDREERKSFINIVKSLTESELQCRMIFVMREEYMAGITEFEKYIPTIFSNRVRIEKMSHTNALEAIKGPCDKFNITLEEGFAVSLLEKLSPGETDVELTYLQVFLDKIFRLSTGFSSPLQGGKEGGASPTPTLTFTLSLLSKIGDVSDLLGSFLEEQISLLDDPDSGLVLLKSFVSVKGTKQPMKPEEAREYMLTLGKDISKNIITELIQTFVNLRILSDKDQNGRYELRHDSLAAKIFEKFTLAEKELLEVRKFVENAYYTFENRGLLLKKDDLDYLAAYENRLILPKNLQDLINTSRQRLSHQKRILTRITRISLIVFILIVASVIRYYLANQSTSREENLIGMINLQSESNPYQSLNSTLSLLEKYPTSTVLKKMALDNFSKLLKAEVDTTDQAYLLQKELKQKILPSAIVLAEISKEGHFIFGCMENQHIFIYDLKADQINYFEIDGELLNAELSEKDTLIALIYNDNTGRVCDLTGNVQYEFTTTPNNVMNERLVCFFPTGEYQLAAVDENRVNIYNDEGEIVYVLKNHTDKINSVDISPDGNFITTASDDKNCLIWNFNKEINQYSVFNKITGHNDTVWSCEFNRTGKYIITASADSTIRIWDLYGKERDAEFSFGYNYQETRRYKTKYGEYDDDVENPDLAPYYRKVCNATFSKDEMSVVATGYSYSHDPEGNKQVNLNQVLYFDRNSKLYHNLYSPFRDIAEIDDGKIIPVYYDHMVISPDGDIVSVSESEINRTVLLSSDGLQLFTQEGNFSFFSNNGSYLYNINLNSISKFPVRISEIKNLLVKFDITGSTEADKGLKMVI